MQRSGSAIGVYGNSIDERRGNSASRSVCDAVLSLYGRRGQLVCSSMARCVRNQYGQVCALLPANAFGRLQSDSARMAHRARIRWFWQRVGRLQCKLMLPRSIRRRHCSVPIDSGASAALQRKHILIARAYRASTMHIPNCCLPACTRMHWP